MTIIQKGELMGDLISRQAAIDALWKIKDERDSVYYTSAIHTAVEAIGQLPSAQPEDCDTCKHGYFGDEQCNSCRVRFMSHYERRTDEQVEV